MATQHEDPVINANLAQDVGGNLAVNDLVIKLQQLMELKGKLSTRLEAAKQAVIAQKKLLEQHRERVESAEKKLEAIQKAQKTNMDNIRELQMAKRVAEKAKLVQSVLTAKVLKLTQLVGGELQFVFANLDNATGRNSDNTYTLDCGFKLRVDIDPLDFDIGETNRKVYDSLRSESCICTCLSIKMGRTEKYVKNMLANEIQEKNASWRTTEFRVTSFVNYNHFTNWICGGYTVLEKYTEGTCDMTFTKLTAADFPVWVFNDDMVVKKSVQEWVTKYREIAEHLKDNKEIAENLTATVDDTTLELGNTKKLRF